MRAITIWKKENAAGEFEYDHYEDGHVTKGFPAHSSRRSRLEGNWKRIHAYLDGNLVVYPSPPS